jgi:hypothetical protein
MKNIVRFFWFVAVIPLFTACHDKVVQTQTLYEPVYLSYENLRKSLAVSLPETLQKPGKIYVNGKIIFINEYLKGIHVIDNSDPAHPQPVAFIKIPGNAEMAVRNNILYADNYVDLVALDISDVHKIREVGRLKNTLPYVLPPNEGKYSVDWQSVDQSKGVVIDWEVKKVSREIHPRPNPWPVYWNYGPVLMDGEKASPSYLFNGGEGGVSTGIGGSMARFTVYDKWLYALKNNSQLMIIRVEDPSAMVRENKIWVRNNPETIFQHEGKLFFGSSTGMEIYDLSDPVTPDFISEYEHIRSCDPVVVQGDYAYVTLHMGDACGSRVNRLDVIDISDIAHPLLKRSYPFTNPYGLAIRDSLLFVCDGKFGLKVMDAGNPLNMSFTASFPGINTYDVIPLEHTLLLIGDDGLFQYKVEGPTQIELLSTIPVTGE